MASSPPSPSSKHLNAMARFYGSSRSQHGKLTCTRRMALWLTDLPDPTEQRLRSLSAPEPHIDAQVNKKLFDLGAPTAGLEGIRVASPLHGHENPLQQHPISPMQLPMRHHVPQRHSSVNFRQGSFHHNLQTTAPIDLQLASLVTDISHLQLGLPQQTTATGLHFDYPQTDVPRLQHTLLQQNTTTSGAQLNHHQDVITRPQPVVLGPRYALGFEPVPRRSHIALQPQIDFRALNDQILAHFDPELQNTVHESDVAMEGQNHRDVDQNTVVDESQAPSPSVKSAQNGNVHCQVTKIRQFFGEDTAKKGESKKRGRSDTPATMASLPPTKRVRYAISSARHRLSRVMSSAADDAGAEGRQSRMGRLTEAAKRMSLSAPLLPPPPQMIRVVGFGPGVVKETVKIAIVGNSGVGKTKLVQAFDTGSYEDAGVAPALLHQVADGYMIDTVNVVLDGIPVALDMWDVSSQCNDEDDEQACSSHSVRPLMATFFDVVVICYDVADEATLEAAQSKWARAAEMFCTGAPTILLGLKTDLRRPLPSLRLAHLKEPTQTSTGQAEAAGRKMVVEACYEVSAKMGDGVVDFFESVVRFALQRRRSCQSRGPGARAKKAFKGLKKGIKKTVG